MKRALTTGMLLAATGLFLSGCEQTATKAVRVQPPTPAPSPAPSYAQGPLPLTDRPANSALLTIAPEPMIDILVEKVQARFDAGQVESKAGNADKAQEEYDRAVNLILKSGMPPNSDPRLAKLFDDLGDVVTSDELDAIKAGETDEDAETPAEPAPIDELTDMTLPAGDPHLAARAQRELMRVRHDLPLTVNDSVLQYLSFFTTTHGRAIVQRGLEREGRYNEMIRRVLREEGVPEDLMYLAQAESAFQPDAVSRAGARGIWQFMRSRGEEYDLDSNYWIDERSDPEKATRAAARHLRDLYGMFGDWYLVMAAYNCGPLGVAHAVERTGYADFWELKRLNAIPKQTQNYVPIILALALVAKDPGLYGVQVNPEKPPQVEAIHLQHPIDLHLVADAASTDYDDLRLLNPQLLRGVTPNGSSFDLKVPAGSAKIFQENIGQVPEDKWTSWRLHAVAQGETLQEIARQYRVTIPAIETANHLEANPTLPAGFLLSVPTLPPSLRWVHYRVQRGDTLPDIAERFDVTVAQLKSWNHLKGAHVARGMRLRIYAGGQEASEPPARAKSAQASDAPAVHDVAARSTEKAAAQAHRVRAGETLYSIARAYQTTVASLRDANPFLAERALQAGDLLMIRP